MEIEMRERWVYGRLPPALSPGAALSAIAAAPKVARGNLPLRHAAQLQALLEASA